MLLVFLLCVKIGSAVGMEIILGPRMESDGIGGGRRGLGGGSCLSLHLLACFATRWFSWLVSDVPVDGMILVRIFFFRFWSGGGGWGLRYKAVIFVASPSVRLSVAESVESAEGARESKS